MARSKGGHEGSKVLTSTLKFRVASGFSCIPLNLFATLYWLAALTNKSAASSFFDVPLHGEK